MIRKISGSGPTLIALLLPIAVLLVATIPPRAAGATTWPEGRTYEPEVSPAHPTRFATSGYRIVVDDFPVHMVHLGAPPDGMAQTQVDAAAQQATQAWSQIPCSFARIDYAGQRNSLQDLGPGEVPFQFVAPGGVGCLPDGSIGWTALSCGPNYPTNSVFLNILDYQWSDEAHPFEQVATDTSFGENFGENSSSPSSTVELQSVLTHEFGHVLGLLHSEDSLATMAPTYRGDGGQKSLAIDDKLGVCALYPAQNAADECSSGRDCPVEQRCEQVRLQTPDEVPTSQHIALCRERRGELGDACAPDQLICVEECAFAAGRDNFGYCTVGCEASACPDNYQCTPELIRPGESHCRRLQSAKSSGCASASGARPAPFGFWLLCASILLLTRRPPTRPTPRT